MPARKLSVAAQPPDNRTHDMHSVDSVASYSSQNHVDRIRTQNFSTASCQDEGDFGSIKTSLFRRSSSNLDCHKRPESVISNTSSTRSRLRELVERKSSQDDHKSVTNATAEIQYFENPTETLEFDKPRNSLESKKSQEERPKKRKLTKSKDKDKDKEICENKNKKHEKYQSKLAEYYKVPAQLPQDEFYQHLTRSKAAEELLHKRFSNSDTEFSSSYGRLCKHKEPEGSNLRRSQSLAVIREETFTDLQIQNHTKTKRSQLIPRARLFDKPCFKDRLPGRAKYQTKEEVLESIYIDSTASCFGDIDGRKLNEKQFDTIENKSEKEETLSRNGSRRSRSVSDSWPNLNEDLKQRNLSEESICHSRNPSEIDSLDSNYVRKHYNFEAHRKHYKDSSPDTERSAVSPDNSKQLYNTDEHDSDNEEDRNRSNNNTPKSFTNDSLSILSEKDKIEATEESKESDDKSDNFEEISLQKSKKEENNLQPKENTTEEEDRQSLLSENDGTISSPPDSITSYISISIASSADKSHKLEYLANSLAEKIDEYCESQFKDNVSVASNTINSENTNRDPLYSKVHKKKTFAELGRESFLNKKSNNSCDLNKHKERFISNTYIANDSYSVSPSSKNITTEPYISTLVENQYYSLPDINISKCLRKSERIDAQLREEDPEDIPCENTYEIAHTHFREILSSKGTENYGQLNKPLFNQIHNINIQTDKDLLTPNHHEPQIIQSFSKLEDDLKSIITIESSIDDDKDLNHYHFSVHQNEREINEIEGTIRNNKIITKSESLKLAANSVYKPQFPISKSLSNSNLENTLKSKKTRAPVRKHYSLRQREPTDDDFIRLPSPSTVERSIRQSAAKTNTIKPPTEGCTKNSPFINRVKSFKTSADSNIAIVPLSGHQTIVIDPPILNEIKDNHKEVNINLPEIKEPQKIILPLEFPKKSETQNNIENKTVKDNNLNKNSLVDTSSFATPKEPFITIKLNKVVKTTIPAFQNNTIENILLNHNKHDRAPPKLIISDNKNTVIPLSTNKNTINTSTFTKSNAKMTRPQVLQVVDSKQKSQNLAKSDANPLYKPVDSKIVNEISDVQKSTIAKEELADHITHYSVKDKLDVVIKTDMEYQEKLHSVKNYWSKLIDKSPDLNDLSKIEMKQKQEPLSEQEQSSIINTEDKPDDDNSLPEISVSGIIKTLESVKIVDSIRKISQSKLQLWKDEAEKVKSDSEIEETTVRKIVKETEMNTYDKLKLDKNKQEIDSYRDTPEIEIVELSSDDNKNIKTQATLIKAKGFDKGCDDFDHVRYKVMKSELFKNSMIANYKKEAQFDGLLQYLQDYSFQELLHNNNIVIIEPVRTKVEPVKRSLATDTCKISPNLLKKSDNGGQVDRSRNAIRRHFFYHPIRVNKEVIEEELPNPDTVKRVRNLFEDTLKMKSPMAQDPPLVEETIGLTRRATSYRNINEDTKGTKMGGRKKVTRQLTIDTNYNQKKWDNASLSSGVSSGDLSSNNEFENEALSPYSQKNLRDNVYSSSDEYLCDSLTQDFCCESQYVSPDILKKIRECGTTVTYYGGKVLSSKGNSTVSPMTKAIMEEIKGLQKNCSRDCYSCQTKCRGDKCLCLGDQHSIFTDKQHSTTSSDSGNPDHDKSKRTEGFPGFKFKLVKSNSCSSRLELTGTGDSNNLRNKFKKEADDTPIMDEENSVKNRICRLESYNKGMVKTPFENKDNIEKRPTVKKLIIETNKVNEQAKKINVQAAQNLANEANKNQTNNESAERQKDMNTQNEKQEADAHAFEKKFYYVNENLHPVKNSTGKFGEMVFEEFEVLDTCYDSLNSNKSMK